MLTTSEVGIRCACYFIPKENEANQIKLASTRISNLYDCTEIVPTCP